MPYVTRKRGEEWCNYKQGSDGEPEGDALGCFESEEKAQEQMAALHAAMQREGEKAMTVKALTDGPDWLLDVKGVPFGGPGDKDAQGEYFTPTTDLWLDKIAQRPVVYYHGLAEAKGAEVIGQEVGWEKRADGVWFRVSLNKMSALAQKVWTAAQKGMARASSGAIKHLVRKDRDGRITVWPMGELSLFEVGEGKAPVSHHAVAVPALKAVYTEAGLSWPDTGADGEPKADATGATAHSANAGKQRNGKEKKQSHSGDGKMEDDEKKLQDQVNSAVATAVAEALKAQREADDAARKAKEDSDKAEQERIDAAVKAEREKWEDEAKKGRRLPFAADGAPVIGQYGFMRRYDHMDAGDTAFMIHLFRGDNKPVSEAAYKALAVKLTDEKTAGALEGVKAMRECPALQWDGEAVKANEINRSTLTSYGDEWAGVAYSATLWENIRKASIVMTKLAPRTIEIPQGVESIPIPIEGTDPVWYKVAQAADDAATGGLSEPAKTVKSSRVGTGNRSLSAAKMGAAVEYTGEMVEDSIIPFVPQLRRQMDTSGAEYLDHVCMDGDTRTTASTNINDIAGTPAGTEAYLVFSGFRYVALATSGRYRSGGAVDEDDFIETAKLLGPAGEGADPDNCSFLVDPNSYWKLLMELTASKTRDVAMRPTLESGIVPPQWGFEVINARQMGYVHKYSPHTMTGYEKKFNTAGKIDQDTAANNTTGCIVLVRWDRWWLGWKRRVTMEVQRYPRSDVSELTALLRVGLQYRDTTHAAAISYNVTL